MNIEALHSALGSLATLASSGAGQGGVLSWLLYPVLGVAAGLLAGLLGIGGGIVVVPVLVLAFHFLGFAEATLTHIAVGTSLATIVFTSVSAIAEHHRNGAIDWPLVKRLTPWLVAGAIAGSFVADALSGRALQITFGFFALLMAVQMGTGWRPGAHSPLPGSGGLAIASGSIGTASSVFGIGGGSLTVPWLSWHGVTMQRAVATSAACGFPIAVAGALGFAWTGFDAAQRPALSLGYVYLPAFIGIVITSVPVARIGARQAHRIPAATLKKLFAVLLAVVGTQFVLGMR
jgi:uncharacterized membrane protein YfcA